MKRKIKIAGAGPAGLTAAICLAKQGYSVELFEARSTVGGRFIGDFQVIENASRGEDVQDFFKRIGISINFFFQPLHEATFYDHRLRPTPVKSRLPYAYFVRRGSEPATLDRGLLEQALEAGAQISYRTRLKADDADVVATGPAVPDGLAKEMTFQTNARNTTSVLFDMALSPGGYSYLFVLEGRATFGCAITHDFDRIDAYFDRAFSRFQQIVPFSVDYERVAYSFMNFCLKRSAVLGNKLYIGEVAGFQDYLFGLGIRYALTTGFAAAQSLIHKDDYNQRWRTELGAGQETSLVNRYLYEKGGNAGLKAFIARAGRGDLRVYLNKWHRPRLWKRLVLPFVKRSLKENNLCRHRIPDHWCRIKPDTRAQPVLGPTSLPTAPKQPSA